MLCRLRSFYPGFLFECISLKMVHQDNSGISGEKRSYINAYNADVYTPFTGYVDEAGGQRGGWLPIHL